MVKSRLGPRGELSRKGGMAMRVALTLSIAWLCTSNVTLAQDAPAPTAPAPASPAAAPDAPIPTTPSDAEVDAEQDASELRRELRTVEEDVSNLKERVFRSKATLKLLKELVVEGVAAGSRVAIWHVNQLGGGYSMESAQYFLDGKNVFSKVDPGGTLDTVREIKVYEQTLPPGQHALQVNYVLRGKGYKVFSYLRSYQFKVQSSYAFDVQEGRLAVVRVIANSKGGLKNFVERPTVRYDERVDTIREE